MTKNESDFSLFHKLVIFMPIMIIANAIVFNTMSFCIFMFGKNLRNLSSMRYLAFICICDTFSLFVWNLDQFLAPHFGLRVEYLNIFSCRFLLFFQFVTLQVGGILRGLICVDRYYAILPKSKRKQFGTVKTANLYATIVLVAICLLNSHIPILAGKYIRTKVMIPVDTLNSTYVHNNSTIQNGKIHIENEVVTFECYQTAYYTIRPFWSRVHMVVNNFIPCLAMLVYNTLLLQKTLKAKQRIRLTKSIVDRNRKRLTLSLIGITVSYFIFSTPASIFYSFFSHHLNTPAGEMFALVFVCLNFIPHCLIFFECYLTNLKFRELFYDYVLIVCCPFQQSVDPSNNDNRIFNTVL